MVAAFAVILPLSLGGAVSPMMLTEQTVLLGASGRRAANLFALGATLTLLALVLLLVLLGGAIELPTAPKLNATLDIVLGVALLLLGAAVHLHGERLLPTRAERPAGGRRSLATNPAAAFPFGAFSMATNFTTLALVVAIAKEISAADVDAAGRALLVGAVVAICSTPAWLPLDTSKLAPRAGRRALDGAHRLIAAHGRLGLTLLLLLAGLFLLARGLFNV